MDPSKAAVKAVLSVIACKLNEVYVDGDDEITMQCIRNVRGIDDGKDVATEPAEFAAILAARKYAGQLGTVLEAGMYPPA